MRIRRFIETLLVISLFLGCSANSVSSHDREHQKFLREVRDQKERLDLKDYQFFLKQKLQHKEAELKGVESQLELLAKRYRFNESAAPTGNIHGAQGFSMNNLLLERRRTKHRKELLQSQIFHLKSQLSSSGD